MVFPNSDYDTSALTESGDDLVFTHSAFGAEKLRYSVNFGKNWTEWRDWEHATTIPKLEFVNKKFFWKGNHVIMNCELFLPTVQLSSIS
jgi:alpha-1,3-glucan synthase